MNARFSTARLAAVLLPALALAVTPMVRAADEKADAKPAAKEKADGVKKASADRRGPLPFYYGKVVAPDQKEKIYSIQDKYEADLKPLAAKIKELQAARDKEIEAVLSTDQLAKIKQMKAEAAAKASAGRKPAAKKPADGDAPKTEKAEKSAAGN